MPAFRTKTKTNTHTKRSETNIKIYFKHLKVNEQRRTTVASRFKVYFVQIILTSGRKYREETSRGRWGVREMLLGQWLAFFAWPPKCGPERLPPRVRDEEENSSLTCRKWGERNIKIVDYCDLSYQLAQRQTLPDNSEVASGKFFKIGTSWLGNGGRDFSS